MLPGDQVTVDGPRPRRYGPPAALLIDGRRAPTALGWSRATPYDGFVFFDAGMGAPLPLDTGVTFVELTRV